MELQPERLRPPLEGLFKENFEKLGELGAAVSIWQGEEPVVDLHGGFRDARREQEWTPDTIVLIWSATKGLSSACLLHVLQEHKIDIGQQVAEFWPGFAKSGKKRITLAQLLSHQAGLAALDRKVDVQNYPAVIEALEKQEPNWEPGTAHGYHARTFGFLLDELVRRIAGKSLSEYWDEQFAVPLGLDLWIVLPENENSRCATMYAAKAGKKREPQDFYTDVAKAGTFAHKVFTSPTGLNSVSAMNDPKVRAQSFPSFGGIGSANSLAKFYAMVANSGTEPKGRRFFSENTIGWMTATLTDGIDRVFGIPTAFSAGFMKDSRQARRRIFGRSGSAFGHPGAGGSHAFADPENRVAFAYVMNQMKQSILPNDKAIRLLDVIYL